MRFFFFATAVCALTVLALIGLSFTGAQPGRNSETVSIRQQAPETNQVPGEIPILPLKPAPRSSVFGDCPPEGSGGDSILNRLKNREDEADQYIPVAFDAVAALTWPKRIERRARVGWKAADEAEVSRFEGTPISVEGYIAKARLEKEEACNCKSKDPAMRDYHIWLTKEPTKERDQAIVVEATPRVRVNHPAWTTFALSRLANGGDRVRISGWLMLDQEHPDQLGKTRGTLWEIHPIMRIEVSRGSQWAKLDDL
jgi:hypothetical protein